VDASSHASSSAELQPQQQQQQQVTVQRMTATVAAQAARPEPAVSTTRPSTVSADGVARASAASRNQGRNASANLQELAETNRRLRQQRTCRLCRQNPVDTIFLPCGHLCTCFNSIQFNSYNSLFYVDQCLKLFHFYNFVFKRPSQYNYYSFKFVLNEIYYFLRYLRGVCSHHPGLLSVSRQDQGHRPRLHRVKQ
jgi:hypothetical protein